MRFVEQSIGVLLTVEFDHLDQFRYVKKCIMVEKLQGIIGVYVSVCLEEDVAY